MNKNYFTVSCLCLLLAGCSFIPQYERPFTNTPAGWDGADTTEPSRIARNWWTEFGSAELNGLMDEALANNNDIRASIQRVEQARGILRASRSILYPDLVAGGNLGYDRIDAPDNNTSTSFGTIRSNGTSSENSYQAGLSSAYELDFFGGNRASVAIDQANLESSAYAREVTSLVVMGDVAKTYFTLVNLLERLSIADQNLESSRELLRIVQARYDAGATTLLDVSQQKSDLASNEASRASLEEQVKVARNSLAVLVGKPPQGFSIAAQNLRNINIPDISPGQPSSLLERRPDIRRTEADLIAANADIGVARAAFFPSITLGLDWTVSSSPISDPATTALSLASGLAAPIFKGGLLEGNLMRSKARKQELLENYRKTVLISFKDVEDALARIKSSLSREESLRIAMDEGRRAYNLSTRQYDAGAIDFQTLLDARRTMLLAEDAYLQSRNERLSAAVDLYKALGGGWAQRMDEPAPSEALPSKTANQ